MPVGGLNVAAIAFGLAACAVTFAVVELVDGALHWIENRRAPQPDEAQLLLALAISGAVIVAAELLRAFELTASVR